MRIVNNEKDLEYYKKNFEKKFVLCTYLDKEEKQQTAIGVVEHITEAGQLLIQGTSLGESWSIHYSKILDMKGRPDRNNPEKKEVQSS